MASIVTNKRGERAVLVNTRTYSVTTTAHQSKVRSAIPADMQQFHVELPSSYRDFTDIDTAAAVASYNQRIADAERKAARARSDWSKNYEINRAAATRDEALAFVKFYGLKGEQAKVAALHTLAEVKRAAAKDAARQAAETRSRKAKLERDNADAIAAWQRGENAWIPYEADTRLRVIGDQVETSRGAKFPITHAKRGLALVDATVARGESWQRNGHSCHLGHYQIDRIDKDGTVHAGCHVVPLKSINAVREQIVAAAVAS